MLRAACEALNAIYAKLHLLDFHESGQRERHGRVHSSSGTAFTVELSVEDFDALRGLKKVCD